jgi:UDP-glucose 4-epimerase
MKKYLVTGAAGFIGSAIAKKLLHEGHEVWSIDNLSTGLLENLPPDLHFVRGDCQDPDSIKALEGTIFDAILHFAGQSSGEISFDDPVYDLRTNTESTLRLIDYGLSHGCRRFIYASSMSVYGAVDEAPIAETHGTAPLSFYGIGKMASEHYMRIYVSKGLQPTALRLFNVYGPHQNLNNLRQGMVSIYLAQMLFSDKIIVKGANDRFRDFVYVDDVVDFTCNIIDDVRSYGGVYNVATGIKTTVETLILKLKEYSGMATPILYDDGTPGDQKGIYADCSLARDALGFQSRVGLDEGLKKMIDWARQSNRLDN